MSAGVDGMTTLSPGMWASSDLEALRVLASRGAPGAELGPHGQRHLRRPAGHERQLRRLVEQLVEADAEEVEVHHLDHRAHPGHGRTHAEADDRRLGDRGVAHPVAELDRPARGSARRRCRRRRRRCRRRTPGRRRRARLRARSGWRPWCGTPAHRPAGGGGSDRAGLARTTKSVSVAACGLASRRAASTASSSSSATDDSSALISSSPTPASRSRPSCASSGSRASQALTSSGDR